jgi:DNA-binding MarR family transcriptional regulator
VQQQPRKRRTPASDIPLERVIRIAEFRAHLRTFMRRSELSSRKWDLTPQRYQMLLAIKGAPDGSEQLSVSALADRLQLERNTVTELARRAEEAGLLQREVSDADQRVVFVRLTDEGERRLAGVIRESDAYRRDLLAAFDELAAAFRVANRRSRTR